LSDLTTFTVQLQSWRCEFILYCSEGIWSRHIYCMV